MKELCSLELFLEEIEEGLTVAIHNLGSSATSLFFYQDLGLKKRTEIVHAFVGNTNLYLLCAFIAR